ncbi:hypothetical protein A2997_01485 [Candidatus Nomurabacteria bacterium RIFCSPLOWO2_01_FULL_36_10b]|uniref:Uncharacterized protein n=1 Tax=Candidatus Nomurabacteria bacterium RIFCSPLOWO2_01_FULL_36_10b TaxID=1801766 RepID=A0A1F6WNA3_9BACT|nr:MAG: hypothetical protein A2997_01485 [Candidatus Nomurabacteria bacterium RIFCSPLOWO2_01_FULL_36_10b]
MQEQRSAVYKVLVLVIGIIVIIIILIAWKMVTNEQLLKKAVEYHNKTIQQENNQQRVTLYRNTQILLPIGWIMTPEYHSTPAMEEAGENPEIVGYMFRPRNPDATLDVQQVITLGGYQYPGCENIEDYVRCDNKTTLFTKSNDEETLVAYEIIINQLNEQGYPNVLSLVTNPSGGEGNNNSNGDNDGNMPQDNIKQNESTIIDEEPQRPSFVPEEYTFGSIMFTEGVFIGYISPSGESMIVTIPKSITLGTQKPKHCLGDSEIQTCFLGTEESVTRAWEQFDNFY